MVTLDHKRAQSGTKIPLGALLGVIGAFFTDSQAEGRRFAAKLRLAAQASEAGSRTRSRAPFGSTIFAILHTSQFTMRAKELERSMSFSAAEN
jgi:hypothetical protein